MEAIIMYASMLVGYLLIVSLLCMVIFLCFMGIYDKLDQRRRQKEWELRDSGARSVGVRIMQGAHWFSEYPEAYILVRDIGIYLNAYGQFDAEAIRRGWIDRKESVRG